MLRLDWSLSRLVTQDIKTQPQINRSCPTNESSNAVSKGKGVMNQGLRLDTQNILLGECCEE